MLKARRPAAISFVVGESRPRTVGRTVGRLSRRRTVGPNRHGCQQPRGGGPRRRPRDPWRIHGNPQQQRAHAIIEVMSDVRSDGLWPS
jgi:hypothetical protein